MKILTFYGKTLHVTFRELKRIDSEREKTIVRKREKLRTSDTINVKIRQRPL